MIKKTFLNTVLSAFIVLSTSAAVHADELKLRRPEPTEEQLQKIHDKLADFKSARKVSAEEVVYPDPALDGWWQAVIRGDQAGFGIGARTNDIDSYIYIDTSTFDPEEFPFVVINTLCGTPVYPRECTRLDVGTGIQLNLYYVPNSNELVHVFDTDGPFFDPINGESWWSLQLQDDGLTLCTSADSQPSWVGYNPTSAQVFKKVAAPQQPVRPYGDTDAAFSDVTDPVEIAKYIRNSLLLNHNQPQNVNMNDTDYLSYYDAEAVFQKMLDEGITYETKIRKVRASRKGSHLVTFSGGSSFESNDQVTDIFTDGYAFATPGATVEISGFKGKWAKMNGTYVNGVAVVEADGIPNPSPEHVDTSSSNHPKHGTFRSVHMHFLLDFDSSDEHDFPRDHEGWAEDVHGEPVVKVTHRFTSDMQYPEFFAAIRAFFYEAYKVSSHNSYVGYFKKGSLFLIDTWDELKEAAATNNFWGSSQFPGDNMLRTRTLPNVPSGFYNNSVLAERGITTYNDPFGIKQEAGSKYDYNIVLSNYNVYFAIAGTPDLTPAAPNGMPLQFDPTDIGYKPAIPGPQRAEFVGALGDIIVVDGRPVPQNPNPTYYSLLTGGSGDDILDSNGYYIGLIDPSLTGGKKVGYLRWIDELASDPFGFIATSTFAPDVPVTAKYAREACLKVYSEFTRYFQTELDCDAVILDIRTNNGGYVFTGYDLAELFGDDRAGMFTKWARKDDGNSALLDLTDSNKFEFYNSVVPDIAESFDHFYVRQNEQNYGPGAVFKGSYNRPKKVIILDDSAAASGGDVFPHYFLGENLDGNLGSYTTCKIIGDMDGRLKGGATARMAPPVSKYSNFLYDASGNPFPPIRFRADSAAVGMPINGLTGIYYNQQPDQIAPSFAPSLKGTAGGAPLPNDWHNTVWPDLGFTKAPEGHFSKKIPKGKPNPNDQKTWRDAWLEQAILAAIE